MTRRQTHIVAHRCPEGRLYLHDHGACPACGAPLAAVRIPSTATLVTHTTVRVNPAGEPYRIGVAVAAGGAATLCFVEGSVRGNGRDRVTLVRRDGRYYALAARARVTERSQALLSNRKDSQRS